MSRRIFDEEHDMFRDSVRNFLQNEIQPHVDKWQEQEIVDREAFEKAGEMGLQNLWIRCCRPNTGRFWNAWPE